MTIWGRNNSIKLQTVTWAVGKLELGHERIDAGGAFGGLVTTPYHDLIVVFRGRPLVLDSH